jgi:hypothetical protein
LILATVVGIAAGAILGIFIIAQKNGEQLEFVEGSSLSIVTEKIDFEVGEVISIKIVNSGTDSLTFSDASYGLKITGLDGRLLYSPIAAQVISVLEPKEEVTILWDQIKNDGDPANGGTYKITTTNEDQKVKKSITINIHK